MGFPCDRSNKKEKDQSFQQIVSWQLDAAAAAAAATATAAAAAAAAAAAKSLQLCPTLCDPIDSSPPGSRIPGILQARTLEWVAISFSSA